MWHPFTRSTANSAVNAAFEDSESTATFYDTDGAEITTVPDNRTVNVSAYLEAGTTYAPVISAVNENKASGAGSSSGGCSAGIFGLAMCVLFFRKYSR